jgi:DNA repair photolyase
VSDTPSSRPPAGPRGRAASSNPTNRFERIEVELEEPGPERVATVYLRDTSRSIISYNDSPDVPFDASLNPYRGCEHGCVYCYARPTHEYLGFSAGLDFETRIMVKEDAPELLAAELDSPRWKPRFIGLSGVTDPYQPVERKLGVTRRCLEVLAAYRNPVGIVTKNGLVRRDADLLAELAGFGAAAVYVSITTLDPDLARVMEPRTSHPRDRLAAIRELTERGIPCGVLVAPVLPGLTDSEIPRILEAAAAAGARSAGFIPLRLPGAVAPLFEAWLDEHFPDRKKRVLNRVRDMRGGRLNDARFGSRMKGEGQYAEQMKALFDATRRKVGLEPRGVELSAAAFRRPSGHQLELF